MSNIIKLQEHKDKQKEKEKKILKIILDHAKTLNW